MRGASFLRAVALTNSSHRSDVRGVEIGQVAISTARRARLALATAGKARGLSFPSDPLRRILFLVMLLTISRVHQHFDIIGRLRPAFVLILLAAFLAIANRRSLQLENVVRSWPAKLVAAIGVMACLSVPFAISIGASGRFIVESFSKVLIFAFLIVAATRNVRDLALFMWAYVLASGILVWMTIFVFDLSAAGGMRRLGGLYTYDANDVGCVLAVGLALTLLMFQTSRGRAKMLSVLILVGIGASLARTGSRGGFLGLLAVGAALLVSLGHVPVMKRLAFVGAVVAGLVVAAPPGYWEQMETLKNPKEDYNWTDPDGRKNVARRGIGYMLDNPITGIGVGNFRRAEGLLSEKALTTAPGVGVRWTAAHNSYVQVGAELGIPGLALWSALLFGGIIGMHRLRRRLPKRWLRGDWEERFLYHGTLYLPVALVGFAVTSFFVSFAYMDPLYILAAFMAGIYRCAESKLRYGVRLPTPAARPLRTPEHHRIAYHR